MLFYSLRWTKMRKNPAFSWSCSWVPSTQESPQGCEHFWTGYLWRYSRVLLCSTFLQKKRCPFTSTSWLGSLWASSWPSRGTCPPPQHFVVDMDADWDCLALPKGCWANCSLQTMPKQSPPKKIKSTLDFSKFNKSSKSKVRFWFLLFVVDWSEGRIHLQKRSQCQSINQSLSITSTSSFTNSSTSSSCSSQSASSSLSTPPLNLSLKGFSAFLSCCFEFKWDNKNKTKKQKNKNPSSQNKTRYLLALLLECKECFALFFAPLAVSLPGCLFAGQVLLLVSGRVHLQVLLDLLQWR